MHLDGIIPLLKLKYNEKKLILHHKNELFRVNFLFDK